MISYELSEEAPDYATIFSTLELRCLAANFELVHDMAESKVSRTPIGIDLGTTNSRVAVWLEKENRFELIVNDHGNRSTASCVAFTGTERLIGDSAKNQVWRNPTNTIFGKFLV